MGQHGHVVAENAFSAARNNTHRQWWKDPGMRKLNILLIGPMLSSIAFGYDAAMIAGLLANKVWVKKMNMPSSTYEGLLIAALAFGALLALFPVAWATNRFGRRTVTIICAVCLIAGTIGQAFVNSSIQFLGVRLFLGFVELCLSSSANILVAELAHPRQRGQITALWFTFFYLGSITVAWVSFGALNINNSWTWRLPVFLQSFWNFVQLPFLCYCPESPRFLAMRGRNQEARQVLAKYHANGVLDDELVQLEYEEIVNVIAWERTAEESGWLSLVKTKASIRRTLLIVLLGFSTQWVGNNIITYYFTPVLETVGITSSTAQDGINGGLQIFNWICSIGGALLSERLGRKTLLLISACGMLVFMVLVTACSAVYAQHPTSSSSGYAVIVFLFLFFGFYDVGFTPIPPLYVAEISPNNIRAQCVSLYWFCTAVALCFNQFVNPIALAAIHWKYYIVYIAVLVFVIAMIYFFAPETKGLTLEEVAGLFADDAATATVQALEHLPHGDDTGKPEAVFIEFSDRDNKSV